MNSQSDEKNGQLLSVLAAWTVPFAIASLAFGTFLVIRNSAAGIPWTSPAIFCGGPAGVLIPGALVLGVIAYVLFNIVFKIRAFGRPALNLFIASWIAFSYVGYQIVREYRGADFLKFATGTTVGIVAGIISLMILRSSFAKIFSIVSLTLGFVAIAMGGAALYSIHSPGAVTVKAESNKPRDPRDFVPKFDPLPNPPKREKTEGRLFVVAVDGATWDKIDPLIQQKRLPNFEKLRKDGATARLRTILPTASPRIWTTIVTGHTPESHGILDFVSRRTKFLPTFSLKLQNRPLRALFAGLDLYTVIPVTSSFRRKKAIWNIASELKIPISVIGWWASYPAEPVENGWIVSDAVSAAWAKVLTGPREQLEERSLAATTYPEDLGTILAPLMRAPEEITRDELAKFMPVDDETWNDFNSATTVAKDSPLSIFRTAYVRDEFYVASAFQINSKYKPDILICYTRLTDDAGHFFWKYSEAEAAELGVEPKLIERYKGVVDKSYEWADAKVGMFMNLMAPNDTLIVCSDHGWERAERGKYHHSLAPDGIVAFYGAGVKSGYQFKDIPQEKSPHILDMGPTIYYLAGIPKGKDMPGRLLLEAFTFERKEKQIDTWETNRFGNEEGLEMFDSEAKRRELEELGYIGKKK
ncbi:MAG: alkaline phosphatase family protein [Planctomycetota bacterium]